MLPTADAAPAHDPYAALRVPDFRRLVSARVCSRWPRGCRALVVSWQIYHLTNNPLALGLIGLGGGHSQHRGVAVCRATWPIRCRARTYRAGSLVVLLLCAAALAWLASPYGMQLLAKDSLYTLPLYAVIFVSGLARGFMGPALFSFMPQLLPDRKLLPNAITWNRTT